MRSTERIGLLALYEECGLKQDEVDEETIGFGIAPNLNALGRISDATVGVELLTTMDEQRASEIAKNVLQQNIGHCCQSFGRINRETDDRLGR